MPFLRHTPGDLPRLHQCQAPTAAGITVRWAAGYASMLAHSDTVRCSQARLAVFVYSLALHALVFFTLMRWGHVSHGQPALGAAELQLLCHRAGQVRARTRSGAAAVHAPHG